MHPTRDWTAFLPSSPYMSILCWIFAARAKGEGVEVLINFRNPPVPVHTYNFEFHPRDLDHPQFEWEFQRQLYDCLHDYMVEMFIRTPQDRAERQRRDQ